MLILVEAKQKEPSPFMTWLSLENLTPSYNHSDREVYSHGLLNSFISGNQYEGELIIVSA